MFTTFPPAVTWTRHKYELKARDPERLRFSSLCLKSAQFRGSNVDMIYTEEAIAVEIRLNKYRLRIVSYDSVGTINNRGSTQKPTFFVIFSGYSIVNLIQNGKLRLPKRRSTQSCDPLSQRDRQIFFYSDAVPYLTQ